ncbi:tyrosine-type recombinase/integrase [Rodentibacter myodis]|uniref:Tyr recombinase domain-containing protein n=1 Tax=Rodentibacter myodis TaxID=1907939 RepID=A0A1V3JI93_9PAST|nr:integrase arm-type DNA-binding domain-containing protein [Rodentibacter myodis]OOF56022.1 hypothetical protein BKL49_10790 [Rodentibacter myodis]
MSRTTKPLRQTEITKAKPKINSDGSLSNNKLTDGKGLYLLVTPNGSKLWRLNYYKPITKKRTEMSLGAFPDVSLAEVRQKREEILTLLAQGIDPQIHRQQQEIAELTRRTNIFLTVAESWRESKKGNIKELTLSKYWAIVENYLLPILGNLPISEITPAIAKRALEIPYKQGKAEMYRKSVKLLNAILNYAVYSLFAIPFNPCEKIATAFEPPKRGKNPSIKPEELPQFLEHLENSSTDLLTRYLIKWQLLTMVRPNEAVTAEWSDIDEHKGVWTIPAHKMKQTKANADRPHLVPLSKQAKSLLEKIKRLAGNSPYLFPSLRSTEGHCSSQTANKAIRDNMSYKGKQTAHGLRKIASTYLHEKGIMPDVVEMCLAHTIQGIRGVYNEAEYLTHRKKALQVWGDYVEQCQLSAIAHHLKMVV